MVAEIEFLEINSLTKSFDGLKALEKIDLSIEKGKVCALIGPNGAGKTTFFNCISGVNRPTSGAVRFQGQDISRLKPHQISRQGMARTFQNIRLFSEMTVLENVIAGRYIKSALPVSRAFVGALLRNSGFMERASENRKAAFERIDFVGLMDQRHLLARNLSYGDQRRLEIARALASEPALLLLDEPAAGMNPQETRELMALIKKIRNQGVTPFMIEHNMQMVMGISDYIVVLDHGVKISEGSAAAVQKDPKVIEAYLGGNPQAISAF